MHSFTLLSLLVLSFCVLFTAAVRAPDDGYKGKDRRYFGSGGYGKETKPHLLYKKRCPRHRYKKKSYPKHHHHHHGRYSKYADRDYDDYKGREYGPSRYEPERYYEEEHYRPYHHHHYGRYSKYADKDYDDYKGKGYGKYPCKYPYYEDYEEEHYRPYHHHGKYSKYADKDYDDYKGKGSSKYANLEDIYDWSSYLQKD